MKYMNMCMCMYLISSDRLPLFEPLSSNDVDCVSRLLTSLVEPQQVTTTCITYMHVVVKCACCSEMHMYTVHVVCWLPHNAGFISLGAWPQSKPHVADLVEDVDQGQGEGRG